MEYFKENIILQENYRGLQSRESREIFGETETMKVSWSRILAAATRILTREVIKNSLLLKWAVLKDLNLAFLVLTQKSWQ